MSLAAVIRQLRTAAGLSQTDLAKSVGVTQGFLSQLELGRKDTASAEVLYRLAAALGVSSERFRPFVVGDEPIETPRIVIPSLGTAAAGTAGVENLDVGDPLDVSDLFGRPGLASVRVRGDSMVGAGIFDGDRVVIRHDPAPFSGETAVVVVDDAMFLKVLRQRGDEVWLHSTDTVTRPVRIDPARQNVRVLGAYYAMIRVPGPVKRPVRKARKR